MKRFIFLTTLIFFTVNSAMAQKAQTDSTYNQIVLDMDAASALYVEISNDYALFAEQYRANERSEAGHENVATRDALIRSYHHIETKLSTAVNKSNAAFTAYGHYSVSGADGDLVLDLMIREIKLTARINSVVAKSDVAKIYFDKLLQRQ